MILADKIIEERKKSGMSQEELADKLSVSRQAVSKWESAQTIPDLQRIVMMSELFSVSTDYLLKDEIESEKRSSEECGKDVEKRFVSVEEADEFMSVTKVGSKTVSLGVLLSILCPVLLIFLLGLADAEVGIISQTFAVAVGLVALFVFVVIAVFLFVCYGIKNEKFEFLRKEEFETAYGVTGIVKEKKKAFEPIYTKYLSLGIVICILAVLPLVITSIICDSEVLIASMIALLLCMVAVGVYMIIRVAMVKSSYQILLQEAEYDKKEKKKSKVFEDASAGYWCFSTAVYLAWSFITKGWGFTWIVWPIAGVLFVPFLVIVGHLCGKDD